tara:strand:+ start:1474 stop:1731 length:258 start_codon:yes stop_codon:yes gene_type:complete
MDKGKQTGKKVIIWLMALFVFAFVLATLKNAAGIQLGLIPSAIAFLLFFYLTSKLVKIILKEKSAEIRDEERGIFNSPKKWGKKQ